MHKLSSFLTKLDKSRLMMEANYMLSYGAAEPSLYLLQRYNILEILLPFHAAYLAQLSNKQLGESSAMLMKLFSSLDQLVTCGRPSHDSLWVALLAFHLALITNPQQALVVLTFASVLYHGNWKDGVNFAKRHSEAAARYAPEILDSQGSISDDELAEGVTELAVQVQNSINILTDKHSLQKAMSKFHGSTCSGVVLVSKKMGMGAEVIFDILVKDVRSLKTGRNSFEIDYLLLGKGQMRETRFVLGKVILDTIAPRITSGGEVMKEEKHTMVKVTQSSVDALEENIVHVEFKKRRFVSEHDNQPKAGAEFQRDRAEKRKLIQKGRYALEGEVVKKRKADSAELPEGKAVAKQDFSEYKNPLGQKLDNKDAVTKKTCKVILENQKKKTKGEHDQLAQDEKSAVLQGVKPRRKKEQKGDYKDQQTGVNRSKCLLNVDNKGTITKEHSSKEKRDSPEERNEESNVSLDSGKKNLPRGNLASDEKTKPKAGKRTLSSIFR